MKFKAFLAAIRCYPNHLSKMKLFFKDKRMTLLEKKILKSYLLLRGRKFEQIIELLGDLKSDDLFIESQRQLLIGIAFNNTSHFIKALPYLKKSVDLIIELEGIQKEKITCLQNLFIVNLNLKKSEGMERVLDYLQELIPENPEQELELHRLKMLYFAYINDFKKANFHLKSIKALAVHMSDSQKAIYLIDEFVFFVKQSKFNECERVLLDLKHLRKYISFSNFLFMNKLLDFIQGKSKLYLYPKDFAGHPMIFHQVKVLLALESGEKKSGIVDWECLKAMAPEAYGDNFEYLGDKCLFSLALDKIRTSSYSSSVDVPLIEDRLASKFIEAIKNGNGMPVAKDDLYLAMYGVAPESVEDYNRMSCAIKRIRKKYNLAIVSRKGAYQLVGRKAA